MTAIFVANKDKTCIFLTFKFHCFFNSSNFVADFSRWLPKMQSRKKIAREQIALQGREKSMIWFEPERNIRVQTSLRFNQFNFWCRRDNILFHDFFQFKGRMVVPNRMNFRKSSKWGVGGHFQSKNLCCRFWELWTGFFLAWNWYKRVISGFRVCFFNNCIEKNQNKTHFEEGSSSHTSLRDGSGYQNGWIFGKVPNGRWPPPPPLRMVPISGNHVHAFHTIWPSYLLAYIRPYPL